MRRKIGLELIPKKEGGVIIKNVFENTPAKRQGLSKGMSLLKIDDVIIDTVKDNSKHNVNINSGSCPNDTPDFEIKIFGTSIFYKPTYQTSPNLNRKDRKFLNQGHIFRNNLNKNISLKLLKVTFKSNEKIALNLPEKERWDNYKAHYRT